MKAVLVMEMPENCAECPMEMDVADTSGKLWKGNICRGCGKRNADRSEKPEWCPLVPIPKQRDYDSLPKRSYRIDWANGWNACIIAIGGRDDRRKT